MGQALVAEIILITAGAQADAIRQGASYVARSLSGIGHRVREQISICETQKQLVQAVSVALARSHILVTIGGLGRASGHMAKSVISQGLRIPLELDTEALSALKSYCHRTGDLYTLEDNALAQLPRGAVSFPGAYGKIPGYVISSSKQHIIQLPETPAEIIPMYGKYVAPYLGGAATATVTRTVRAYGVTEQVVRANLAGMLGSENPVVTILREAGEVLVRVAASAESSQQAAALCTPVLHNIVEALGDAAYGLDVESLQSAVIAKLAKKDLELSIAEAGTDGMLTRVIAETDGGQDILRYCVAVDDDAAKTERLGLKPKLLKKRGGSVSEYAAVAMAAAAREKSKTDVGVAIAAVDEDNAKKKTPFGLVYIAVCDKLHVYVKKLVIGDGDAPRDVVVDAATSRALNMLRLFVDYMPGRYPAAVPLQEALDGFTVTDKENYDGAADLDLESRLADPAEEEEKRERKQRAGGALRKIALTVAILVFLASASYVGYTLYQSWRNQKMADELANMFTFGEMGDVEVAPDYPRDYSLKFAGLWNVNRDVRAFVDIPDTGVRYPIVQSTDNDYYLRRDFYQQDNQHGVPYFDFRVNPERPSDNMVVYGHNMTDGQIFGEIVQYKKLDYYKAHPTVNFSTVYGDGVYKIFSVFITNAYENQGHVFDYYNMIDAENEEQLASFLEQLEYRTIIDTPVDAEPGDELLTLSTCTYEFQDARLVVVARKLRHGEEEAVATESAVMNPAPLYPDVWYTVFGGSPPAGLNGNWSVGQNASLTAPGYGGDDTAPAVAQTPSANTVGNVPDREVETIRSTRPPTEATTEEATTEATEPTEPPTTEPTEPTTEAATEATTEETEPPTEATTEATEPPTEATTEATEPPTEETTVNPDLLREVNDMGDDFNPDPPNGSYEPDRPRPAGNAPVDLSVTVNGSRKTGDAAEIVAGIVQNEVGATFHEEAIKAQAVAAYTFVAQSNQTGSSPSVYLSSNVSSKVHNAVMDVLGEAVYYHGSLAFTPYHATSAGQTTSSESVWGGSYPYLVSVDSSVDERANGYSASTRMSSGKVADLIESRLGIDVSGSPEGWIEIESYEDGYVDQISICGESKSRSSGAALTGRLLREAVLGLRSACFDVDYDSRNDEFTFTTYGYGHGVGLSQNGANLYAGEGWDYVDILEHYYPGTDVA